MSTNCVSRPDGTPCTHLEVDVDHNGGRRPEGDDAGKDGEVLVDDEVAAVAAVLPDQS